MSFHIDINKTEQERFARKKHSGLFAGNNSDEEEKV
jgi:hypothetical protein